MPNNASRWIGQPRDEVGVNQGSESTSIQGDRFHSHLATSNDNWSRRRSSLLPKIKLCCLDRIRRRLLRCLILCGFVAFAPSLALGVQTIKVFSTHTAYIGRYGSVVHLRGIWYGNTEISGSSPLPCHQFRSVSSVRSCDRFYHGKKFLTAPTVTHTWSQIVGDNEALPPHPRRP